MDHTSFKNLNKNPLNYPHCLRKILHRIQNCTFFGEEIIEGISVPKHDVNLEDFVDAERTCNYQR